MSMIARALGDTTGEAQYTQHAKRLSALINKVFWDDKDGFYYDRNEKTGKQIHVKSVAGFIPLWIGIASPRQARRLVHDEGKGMNPLWGWSSLAYVMIFDMEFNYDPTDLAGPVRPLLRDVLAIRFNRR
jgi:glycogen debranching enzyme